MEAVAKNVAADAVAADITAISLHTADPGASGTNEVSGGSPAYARKTPSFGAASGGIATAAALEFDVPASTTVSYVGYWAGSTWYGADDITNETFASQGTATVVAKIDFSA
jgi:hypothetical protein